VENGEPLPDSDIRDEVNNFMFAVSSGLKPRGLIQIKLFRKQFNLNRVTIQRHHLLSFYYIIWQSTQKFNKKSMMKFQMSWVQILMSQ